VNPEQYAVTQEHGIERRFSGECWVNEEPGIYLDIVSIDPLFASADKFNSGTAAQTRVGPSAR
jgi:peptide-methionine (R)-S-oxide reductase